MAHLIAFVGMFLILAVVMPVTAFAHALIVSDLWTWFVEPIAHVAAPSLLTIMGLTLFVGLFRSPMDTKDQSTAHLIGTMLSPAVLWLLGYAIHSAGG